MYKTDSVWMSSIGKDSYTDPRNSPDASGSDIAVRVGEWFYTISN